MAEKVVEDPIGKERSSLKRKMTLVLTCAVQGNARRSLGPVSNADSSLQASMAVLLAETRSERDEGIGRVTRAEASRDGVGRMLDLKYSFKREVFDAIRVDSSAIRDVAILKI